MNALTHHERMITMDLTRAFTKQACGDFIGEDPRDSPGTRRTEEDEDGGESQSRAQLRLH